MSILKERISRRKFLAIPIVLALPDIACGQDNDEQPFPISAPPESIVIPTRAAQTSEIPKLGSELTISIDNQYQVRDLSDHPEAIRAGVQKILVATSKPANKVYVYLEFTKDVIITPRVIDRSTAVLEDGFVPYDPSFDLGVAQANLNKQYAQKRPPDYTRIEFLTIDLLSRNFMSGLKFFSVYDIPPTNQDHMYLIGSNGLYTVNGQKPPITVLQTKISFTP